MQAKAFLYCSQVSRKSREKIVIIRLHMESIQKLLTLSVDEKGSF